MATREDYIYYARLAEQGERYEDMIKYMKIVAEVSTAFRFRAQIRWPLIWFSDWFWRVISYHETVSQFELTFVWCYSKDNWARRKETCFQLLTRTLSARGEQRGELSQLFRIRKSTRDLSISNWSSGIARPSRMSYMTSVKAAWPCSKTPWSGKLSSPKQLCSTRKCGEITTATYASSHLARCASKWSKTHKMATKTPSQRVKNLRAPTRFVSALPLTTRYSITKSWTVLTLPASSPSRPSTTPSPIWTPWKRTSTVTRQPSCSCSGIISRCGQATWMRCKGMRKTESDRKPAELNLLFRLELVHISVYCNL